MWGARTLLGEPERNYDRRSRNRDHRHFPYELRRSDQGSRRQLLRAVPRRSRSLDQRDEGIDRGRQRRRIPGQHARHLRPRRTACLANPYSPTLVRAGTPEIGPRPYKRDYCLALAGRGISYSHRGAKLGYLLVLHLGGLGQDVYAHYRLGHPRPLRDGVPCCVRPASTDGGSGRNSAYADAAAARRYYGHPWRKKGAVSVAAWVSEN